MVIVPQPCDYIRQGKLSTSVQRKSLFTAAIWSTANVKRCWVCYSIIICYRHPRFTSNLLLQPILQKFTSLFLRPITNNVQYGPTIVVVKIVHNESCFQLQLEQSGTWNRVDWTINILYRKYILDGTNVLSGYMPPFRHCLSKERI